MQTFVPYPDFPASAVVLDSARLGKQRVETFQILRALTWPSYGWKQHPATKMWRGFVPALVCYGLAICDEWERRGHADATRTAMLEFTGGRVPVFENLLADGQVPPWFGLDAVHRSHQSALVRKAPEYYRAYFPDVPDDLPYYWPSAAFPRWPLRRGGLDAVPLETALQLLGHEEAWEPQARAVEALLAGRDSQIALPPGGGATTAGILAALCMAGQTLWVSPTPLPGPVEAPEGPAAWEGESKVSVSIARAPDEVAAALMASEAEARPEFRFLRPEQVTPAAAIGAGLVVIEGDAVVPDVGLPRLTLKLVEPDPEASVPKPRVKGKLTPAKAAVSAKGA